MPNFCQKCGTKHILGKNFCGGCGAAVTIGVVVTPQASLATTYPIPAPVQPQHTATPPQSVTDHTGMFGIGAINVNFARAF